MIARLLASCCAVAFVVTPAVALWANVDQALVVIR